MRPDLTRAALLGAAITLLAACGADPISAPSDRSAIAANLVTGGSAVSYQYLAGVSFLGRPDVAAASNGDQIRLTGEGVFNLHPKSVSGGGSFTHTAPDGTVLATGTWVASQLLSFNSYGTSPGLPAKFEGGLALIRVHLVPDGGGPSVDAVLEINCLIGSPPPGAAEGVRLAVQGGPNFNKQVSGSTLFIRAVVASLAEITAGDLHSCGVTTGGSAYCWGNNGFGQLGDGTTTNRLIPAAVGGGLTLVAVSAGIAHTCGLTPSGAGFCWGRNDLGQLGDGTGTNRLTPVAVSGGLSFAVVSVGGFHSCGLTPAQAAFCWGDNGNGQLGDATTTTSLTPAAVVGGLTFATLSAGGSQTCGVTPAGAAYCWGANIVGQIGDGTTTDRQSPVAVTGGLTFARVSAGVGHTCGVTSGGAAYCWGDNCCGQLGNGTTTQSLTPVAVSGGLSFATVTAGNSYTCGVTAGGAAYCWGFNGIGELGDGTTTQHLTPVAVAGGLTFAAASASGTAGGMDQSHTCGVTLGGAAYCWGDNSFGELGNGTMVASASPVPVVGP